MLYSWTHMATVGVKRLTDTSGRSAIVECRRYVSWRLVGCWLAGSSQVNAFLHGFSSSTSIVLYDRLLSRRRRGSESTIYSNDEILAVVAHEIGHWTFSHVPKLFVFYQVRALTWICFFLLTPSSAYGRIPLGEL